MSNLMQTDPSGAQSDYITENLLRLATQVQNWRYRTPTVSTSGTTSQDAELGGLGTAFGLVNLLGQGANIADDLGWLGDEGWLTDLGGEIWGGLTELWPW